MKFLQRVGSLLGESLFPNHIKCMFCDEELDGNKEFEVCPSCFSKLPFIKNCCERCGAGLPKGGVLCANCRQHSYRFVAARACFDYTGMILNAIHNFKFNDDTFLARPFAQFMWERFKAWGVDVDLVCPVPAHKKRERQRGYNQAKLLAKEFCALSGLKYFEGCEKIKETTSQVDLDFKHRRENLKDCFAVAPEAADKLTGKSVLVIDDVVTTCSTVDEVAGALKRAGAKQVFVLSVAHTLPPED